MAYDLFTPILNARTRAPHFFNGRLLTGEAMTDEHRAQTVARELLAQSVGEGVAWGLEVEQVATSPIERPSVRVKSGVAINRCGEILLLANDVEVQLVRPAEEVPTPDKVFQTCIPITTNAKYVADPRVYLLTITSIRAGNGLAQVTGLGDTPRGCNIKYIVDAVEFRLLELPLGDATLADRDHLRNVVAYKCFGVDDLVDFATDPFGTTEEPRTLLDDLRDTDELTDCDVPLALFYWTATSGIVWLDRWSVRRRVAHTRVAATHPSLSDRRIATGEAMVLQFQEEIESIATTGLSTADIRATGRFNYLPPVGSLPVQVGVRGFNYLEFFHDLTYRGPVYFEGSRLIWIFKEPLVFAPIKLNSKELIWLYKVRENQQAIDVGSMSPGPTPYLVFSTGHAPFHGDSHYDVAKWNYSNFS